MDTDQRSRAILQGSMVQKSEVQKPREWRSAKTQFQKLTSQLPKPIELLKDFFGLLKFGNRKSLEVIVGIQI